MESILALLAAALYVAATLFFARGAAAPRLARAAAPGALASHGVQLGLALTHNGALVIGVGAALSLFSWQAALLLWLLCLRQPLQTLGLALFPLAALAAVLGAVLPPAESTPLIVGWRAQSHVLISLMTAGLLTLAAAQALFLALQDRFLHRHRQEGLVQSLPPLQTMERLLFQLIGLGFFMLSLTLLSGLWFIRDWFAQHLVHKTVLSLTAWVIFGVLLWGRSRYGWRGRTAIHWALAGYATLVLAYFGSKLVLEEILGRHWS
ncbi:MAG: cytochrome c biogenesis protein CcsA [Gammaproteobacteria bacterium]|nr:cytochrome c biogenesis protein CcsA [Gammaproteobacteria bacterium]